MTRPIHSEHLDLHRRYEHLPSDQYGEMIRAGIQHVEQALATGSTDRLDSHPAAAG